jgi:predicted CXXCH cytochrome family protein
MITMKKLLVAVVLGALLAAALAFTALADNGPHGNFAADTDACASCHRAHTAKGATYLLVTGDVYLLCTSCHDGSGAYTNVVDGVYQNATLSLPAPYGTQGDKGQGLFGGGFENAAMATVRSLVNAYVPGTYPTPAPVTSHHDVETGTAGTVWGSGDINTAAGSLVVECTSCHDPHGKAGRTGGVYTGTPTTSYRLLRFSPSGSNGFETTGVSAAYFVKAGTTQSGVNGGVYVADVNVKWYTVNTDSTIDPSVVAYRARYDTLAGRFTPFWSYVNMPGDYAGRAYVYQRPAMQISSGTASGTASLSSCSPVATGAAIDQSCAYPGNPVAGSVWSNAAPMGNLGYWCSTCHDRYLATGTGRTTDSGDATYMFRHSTTSVACVNCHTAHGTTAKMTTTLAQNATLNTVAGLTGNTNLLKMDNRALCADCHGYDVGYSSSALITP